MNISGTGSWKSLTVTSKKTGTVELTKKFYKADFGVIWRDPQYTEYVDVVFDAAYADLTGQSKMPNIDIESYEEIKSIAIEIENNFINPEK